MDKIDIRNLSVDNWVYTSQGQIGKVCHIHNGMDPHVTLEIEEGVTYMDEPNPQPIPLTEEILLANGYHKETTANIDTLVSEDGRILVSNDTHYLNTNNKLWVHIDNEDMDSVGGLEISNVHEFQNLLRQGGIKENIKVNNPQKEEIETDISASYIARLRDMQKIFDEEQAHINADNVLCDLLTELGYEDVVHEYNKIEKWYA